MTNLVDILTSDQKSDFFRCLSQESYSNLQADILTIFEGLEEDRKPYLAFQTISVSANFCKSIRLAAENFYILASTYAKIIGGLDPDEICDWGLPEDYVPYIMTDIALPCEMRLDIAVNPESFESDNFELSDFKILEANSATPGLWFETFILNSLICKHFGQKCPNENLAEKQTADFVTYLNKISQDKFNLAKDTVYFSFPYSGQHEDILSFDARIGHFEKAGGKAKFCYTSEFVLETDPDKKQNLYSPTGELIKYLFVHYPNEWLIEDEGEEIVLNDSILTPNARPWDYILQLVLDKKLVKLPPISSDIIQNKGLFAFMWHGITNNYVDDDTAGMIQALIPETYCTYSEGHEAGISQIWEKPIYGREGAGVILTIDGEQIVNSNSPDIEDKEWYQNMLAIFQRNCPMPHISFDDTDVTLMFTVYLSAEGSATGISCRASKGLGKTAINAENGVWFPISLK